MVVAYAGDDELYGDLIEGTKFADQIQAGDDKIWGVGRNDHFIVEVL